MRITGDQLRRFECMVYDFVKKHDLRCSVEHDTSEDTGPRTKVYFTNPCSTRNIKPYIIDWNSACSLTDAGSVIFADVMCKFNLNGNFNIKNVIFNSPATIVIWDDGTKTVVKCQEDDEYSEETGLAMAIAKKALGNQGNFNNVFKKWIPDYEKSKVVVEPFSEEMVQKVIDRLNECLPKKVRGRL